MAVTVFMDSMMKEGGDSGNRMMLGRRVFAGGVTRKLQMRTGVDHAAFRPSRIPSGSLTRKRLPSPFALSTAIVPPMRSTV